jgi:hypothetical protein
MTESNTVFPGRECTDPAMDDISFFPRRPLLCTMINLLATLFVVPSQRSSRDQKYTQNIGGGINNCHRKLEIDQDTLGYTVSSQMKVVVQILLNYGLDGALVQCLLGNSNFVTLTMADRQIIVWLLREWTMLLSVLDLATNSVLKWFQWLLLANTCSPSENTVSLLYQKGPAINSSSTSRNSTAVPVGLPKISLELKVLLLQECRLLLFSPLELQSRSQSVFIHPIGSWLSTVPDTTSVSSSQWGLPVIAYLGHTTKIKQDFIESGLLHWLLHFVVGSCQPVFIQTLFELHGTREIRFTKSLTLLHSINVFEWNLWKQSFGLLLQCIRHCTASKVYIDQHFGVKMITTQLIHITRLFHSLQMSVEEKSVINLCIELYTIGSTCRSSLPPFSCVDYFYQGHMKDNNIEKESNRLFSMNTYSVYPTAIQAMEHIRMSAMAPIDVSKILILLMDGKAFHNNFIFLNFQSSFHRSAASDKFPMHSLHENHSSVDGDEDNEAVCRSKTLINTSSKATTTSSKQLANSRLSQNQHIGLDVVESASTSSSCYFNNKWDSESVEKTSTVQGDLMSRSSLHSQQSVSSIFQALKNAPAYVMLNEAYLEDSTTTMTRPPLWPSSETITAQTTISKRSDSNQHLRLQTHVLQLKPHQFLFPTPNSRFSTLYWLSLASGQPITHFILMIHHLLVLRSDLEVWLLQETMDSTDFCLDFGIDVSSQQQLPPQHVSESAFPSMIFSEEGYYSLLRMHMYWLLLPADDKCTSVTNERLLLGTKSTDSMFRIQFRAIECLECLLSIAMASSKEIQMYLLDKILQMVRGHPANASMFAQSESSLLLVLIELYSESFDCCIQASLGNIISQVFSCQNCGQGLRRIFQLISTDRLTSPTNIDQNALVLLRQTCERLQPKIFLHFQSQSFPTVPIKLPVMVSTLGSSAHNITSNRVSGEDQLTVYSWIRVGHIEQNVCHVLTQWSSHDQRYILTIFLRRIDSPSSADAQKLQLCISLQLRSDDSNIYDGQFRNTPNQCEINNPNSYKIDAVRSRRKQLYWSSGLENWFSANSSFSQDENERRISSSSSPNAPKDIGQEEIEQQEIQSIVSKLHFSIASFTIPDFLVELSIPDDSPWMFLSLSLGSDQVSCSINGVSQCCQIFSPFGYMAFPDAYSPLSSTIPPSLEKLNKIIHMCNSKPQSIKDSIASAMDITIGNVLVETNMILRLLSIEKNHSHRQNVMVTKAVSLANAFSACIHGFDGFISDFIVVEDILDHKFVLECAREGPVHGLISTTSYQSKPYRLCYGFKQSDLYVLAKDDAMLTSLSGLWSKTRRYSNSDRDNSNNSSSISPINSNTNSIHNHWLELHLQQPLPIVQLCRTGNLLIALKQLGGFRLLLPFLDIKASLATETLRIFDLLTTATQDFNEFKSEQMETVLLYLFVSDCQSIIQTTEAVQVLFNWSLHLSRCSKLPVKSLSERTMDNVFINMDLIRLLIDMLLGLNGNVVVAKTIIDSLCEMADDRPDLVGQFMKSIGLLPCLTVLCNWSMEILQPMLSEHQLSRTNKSIVTDKRKVSFIDTNGINSTLSENIQSTVKPRTDSPTTSTFQAHLSIHDDQLRNCLDSFHMHISCCKWLRVLIYGTVMDNYTPINSNGTMTRRHVEFTGHSLQTLFLFGMKLTRYIGLFTFCFTLLKFILA